MANTISLAVAQYNGSFTVTGDVAATGYYTLVQGNVLQSFSGSVTGLGSFSALLDTTGGQSIMKYKLEPASSDTADDLMDAILAIEGLINAAFSIDVPVISGDELFGTSTSVSISVPTRATVYYTTNGDTPTSDSTAYTEPFTLNATATVKAIAIKDGVASEVASQAFTKLAAPTISGDTPFAETTSVTMSGPDGVGSSSIEKMRASSPRMRWMANIFVSAISLFATTPEPFFVGKKLKM